MSQIINFNSSADDKTKNTKSNLSIFDCSSAIYDDEEFDTEFFHDTIEENEYLIKQSNPNKLLFSLEETSLILGVSYDFIRVKANQGVISVKYFGKRKMIHLKELSRLITEGVI